ncbi:DUF4192 domain-containing protein [Mycolicibacterium sp. F2034L]|uniref:DUF4192 domain-containing protein n=1 Tax=Mycolicibacterium sp. F2034L TaxID=2926422 RepID=UPI001FF17993|nr:DUF4192 domain-containing protein [Mycolicibacterium sp. F2034L]MCK0177545.1 DUF4192 domain-containing protein [Mycolicibacterium sp. F2034L]
MTTSRFPDLILDNPGALIAALPAVLGFAPEHSLVLLTVDCGELGCVLRINLHDDPAEMALAVAHLADVAGAAQPHAAIAVVVDPEGGDHGELTDDLAEALAGTGIELLDAHVVDRVAEGGRWYCADGCGRGGLVDDPAASPLAMAAVLDGRRLYRRRSDLEAVIAIDPARIAALAPLMSPHTDSGTDVDPRTAVDGVVALAGRMARGHQLTDEEAAAVGLALGDLRVRDTLFALAVGVDAGPAEELWAAVARILPLPWRTEALVLLAFSAYARGDGPLAGVALEAALCGDDDHRMAGMLDQALQSGMRPESIRELAVTGYRLADQLGVTLPQRRRFRRRAD